MNSNQVKAVSGGIWGPLAAIAVGLIAEIIKHRHDKDAVRREGMDPTRRETTGF